MKKSALSLSAAVLAAVFVIPASAAEPLRIERQDAQNAFVVRDDSAPASFWLSKDPVLDDNDVQIARDSKAKRVAVKLPVAERDYVIMQRADGTTVAVAERVLPLEQGSNFRDLGGYQTKDGKIVRWGKAYRSGAMPMLTEADYALLDQLAIGTVVDFRSLEEREVAPDLLDDRTGALFIANDYSIKPLLAKFGSSDRENIYEGMEDRIAPQLRSLFKRLLADDGAVVYHCSAGQDRTGVATALIYDILGMDRATILKDYHLSTGFRRVEFEMPPINAADYPNNPIVQYYVASQAKGSAVKAEPLYTPSGQSHLAQFFAYLDARYGGSAAYFQQELGFTPTDLEKLRANMLQ
ncbi:tyrosine-protein phosphatase [Caenibius sp. WL]|uniref:tyrosine-protein phosphatase n=1 Tax=Caenibius sp. WL TaxID=2872646 RepID=UPI001C992607|nr:tyrosine-protein phosphatase [Caenibius sp. WL]QZP09154.1 tyrosine-protein phosphatase [Caenibius sp. WL]